MNETFKKGKHLEVLALVFIIRDLQTIYRFQILAYD